jgi:hypothetical protein
MPVALRADFGAAHASSSATRVQSTEFSASTFANRAQNSSTRTKSRMVTAFLSTAVAESKSGEGAMRSLTHIRRNYESPSGRRESLGRRCISFYLI